MFKRWYRKTNELVHLTRMLLFGRRQTHGRVTVIGEGAFVRATIDVLELLKTKTPDVYTLLEKHIWIVISGKHSCVVVNALAHMPTTMTVVGLAQHQRQSVIENAGGLAHEAYHCELYRRAEQSAHGGLVPKQAYSGEHAESMCLEYQCEVLRRLGLDEALIDRFYESSLQSRWWEVPYEQIDW
jgi:hypothetical protein